MPQGDPEAYNYQPYTNVPDPRQPSQNMQTSPADLQQMIIQMLTSQGNQAGAGMMERGMQQQAQSGAYPAIPQGSQGQPTQLPQVNVTGGQGQVMPADPAPPLPDGAAEEMLMEYQQTGPQESAAATSQGEGTSTTMALEAEVVDEDPGGQQHPTYAQAERGQRFQPGPPNANPQRSTAQEIADESDTSSSGDQTYTVQSGDNLWNIAKRFLGDPRRFMEIASMNNIEDPDLIQPGMTLELPMSDMTAQMPQRNPRRG